MVNWYISFLSDRKQRLVYNGTACDWMMVNKGTTQGSVSGPHLFNLFLDDLDIDSNLDDVSMVKYADDSTILVTVNEGSDNSETQFMDWTNNNSMKCNTTKCKELVIRKKSNNSIYPIRFNIKQFDHITLLGETF